MAVIQQLTIQHFRNLTDISLKLNPAFNIFYGDNGAGKTSLLECLYYLALNKSFRTSYNGHLVQHKQSGLLIYCVLEHETGIANLGVERQKNGHKQLKLDGERLASLVPVVKLLPMLVVSSASYRFFTDGPKERRQYLDWIVFHVKPSYHPLWQRFQKVLKQRNSLLKMYPDPTHSRVWDDELVELALQIDQLRCEVIALLAPILQRQLAELLPQFDITLSYQRGWDDSAQLIDVLERSKTRDQQLGYTTAGPHRADFQLKINDIPISQTLSQGQQKCALYGLRLAQGVLLKDATGVSPVYLFDDLPSELDQYKRALLFNTMYQLQSQVFITGIEADSFTDIAPKMQRQLFHVEHGIVTTLEEDDREKNNSNSIT